MWLRRVKSRTKLQSSFHAFLFHKQPAKKKKKKEKKERKKKVRTTYSETLVVENLFEIAFQVLQLKYVHRFTVSFNINL